MIENTLYIRHLHTTTTTFIDGCRTLLLSALIMRDMRDKVDWWQPQVLLLIAYDTRSSWGWLYLAMVVINFLWFYFVCNYYVAPWKNIKVKTCMRVCRRPLPLDNFTLDAINSLVSTPHNAIIGWSNILRSNPLFNYNYNTTIVCAVSGLFTHANYLGS